MSLLTLIPAALASEELHPLVMPIWAFPLIAAGAFLLMGLVSWSYRDVAHRHADHSGGSADGHQDAHH